tara:strand:- start:1892 stop:2134 length:243 start_codon:yes stop_codon:yes gene_type:complete
MTETPKAPTMEPAQLREEFTKQLADANDKISKAETELIRLREYRTKLQGGLETLGILTGEVNAEPLPTPETEAPETPPTE